MEKLISNTDYGIKIAEMVIDEKISIKDAFLLRCKYDQFLSMPLGIKMFVPCDGEDVLLEPNKINYIHSQFAYEEALSKYKEALSEVIFEGFEVSEIEHEKVFYPVIKNKDTYVFVKEKIEWIKVNDYKKIEDLVKLNLTLTPQAKEKYKF